MLGGELEELLEEQPVSTSRYNVNMTSNFTIDDHSAADA